MLFTLSFWICDDIHYKTFIKDEEETKGFFLHFTRHISSICSQDAVWESLQAVCSSTQDANQ